MISGEGKSMNIFFYDFYTRSNEKLSNLLLFKKFIMNKNLIESIN